MRMRNGPGRPAQRGPELGARWEIFPHVAYYLDLLSNFLSVKTVACEGFLSPCPEQAFLAHTELFHASHCGGRILLSDERQGHGGIICMWLLSMFLRQCTKNSAFKSVEFSPQRNSDRNTPKNFRIPEVHATYSANVGRGLCSTTEPQQWPAESCGQAEVSYQQQQRKKTAAGSRNYIKQTRKDPGGACRWPKARSKTCSKVRNILLTE